MMKHSLPHNHQQAFRFRIRCRNRLWCRFRCRLRIRNRNRIFVRIFVTVISRPANSAYSLVVQRIISILNFVIYISFSCVDTTVFDIAYQTTTSFFTTRSEVYEVVRLCFFDRIPSTILSEIISCVSRSASTIIFCRLI